MADPTNIKIFKGLLGDEFRRFEQVAERRSYEPGEIIFQEGERGDGLYVVLEGEVRLSALMRDDQRRDLGKVLAGDFFGEMAILDDEPRSATAAAGLPAVVYFVEREKLKAVLEEAPKLAFSLMREFSLKMRESNRKYITEMVSAERLAVVGRFARSIVHDFKNPLNVIGLAAELAGMDNATPEMRKTAQKRIRKQVDRLGNMISEVLEFTRGGGGGTSQMTQVDYAEYAAPLLEDIRAEVEARKVVLEVDPFPALKIRIDTQRLTHVFYNLINNAADEMPDGGRVHVRFRTEGDMVVTEVQDSGGGIDPEIANRLFEAFATHGKPQGTGLGLSICKKIIEDHGGKITAGNAPEGGALFTFSLPVAKSG